MDLKSLEGHTWKIIFLAIVGSGFVIGITCISEYWLGEKEDHRVLFEFLTVEGSDSDQI
jgi:hypothetical protein